MRFASFLIILLCAFVHANAQDTLSKDPGAAAEGSGDEIEALFMGSQTRPKSQQGIDEKKADTAIEADLEKVEQQQAQPVNPQDAAAAEDEKQIELRKVSDLVNLSNFKDVAIVQKRYLPKTKRFEAYGSLAMIMNDPFFLGLGANARLGYYFSERFGAEFAYLFLTNTEREVTRDLKEQRGVLTNSIITPRSFIGGAVKWIPMYGKVTFLNRKITPFDLYFNAGAGMTTTNQDRSEPTVMLGAGQVFAINKGMAFRWDFTWNFFSAQAKNSSSSSIYNNLFLSLGMSFYFPKAKYR